VDEATLGHKSLIQDEDDAPLMPISEHDGLSDFGQVKRHIIVLEARADCTNLI
jgi:hypothetical protein